ncbi:AfsR/SARP family transcriptional regulator [Symbioplanes lichenis]|uniref:AfsR/SARP family transcriptional regulator n=1 Tax=Symbioplanes lichenis TaxID=1629072 RepID=UPI0027387D9B|nr:BTAD domain-containing putative transcriptional regulator [Actinoplanes lichenis]
MEVEFKILGPVEIRAGAARVPLAGPRQESVVVALVSDRGRVVQVDRLVDLVWPEQPPATARRQIQDLVSRLRRTLAAAGAPADLISTAPGGYVLSATGCTSDVQSFQALVERAEAVVADDPGTAAARLSEAFGLWRGDPAAGPCVRWITDRRLEARELWLELEVRLGRHRRVLGEMLDLLDEWPCRERLALAAMAALVRVGRRGHALVTYERTRRALADDLGVDPGPELRLAYRRIIEDEPISAAAQKA